MESYQGTGNKLLKNIAKGIGTSLFITFILLFIFSAVLTYTYIGENTINPVIMVVTGISILIGSSMGNKNIKKNGIINGAIIGGAYIVILYCISSILNWKFALSLQSIIMIAIGVIFGILGGIVGVNKK